MVSLPEQFTATKYPGYFWNTDNFTLYSLKSGVLKKMKVIKPSVFNNMRLGYRVCVNGSRRWLDAAYLYNLKKQFSIIPICREEK